MITTLFIVALILIYFVIKFNTTKKNPALSIPDFWHVDLLKYVPFYKSLNHEQQSVFKNRMALFLKEIQIEGVHIEVADKDEMLIAASAVIPVFHFPDWHYNNLKIVWLYPDRFNQELGFAEKDENRNILGLVGTGRFENQMILSQKALYHGFRNNTDKLNTAVHEFVHLIDKMDGKIDGIPQILMNQPMVAAWLEIMHHEMEQINNDKSDIRSYGGTSEAEFFAVACEYFFSRPKLMKRKHPDIYQMLESCFLQETTM